MLELIAVLFVTTKLVRGGQLRLLPFYVKMIVGFYIVFVLFMALTAGTLAVVLHDLEHIETKWLGRTCFNIGYFFWNLIHWIFIFHYMRVACLFKMTF